MTLLFRAGALGALVCLASGGAELRAQAAPGGPAHLPAAAADSVDTVPAKKKGGLWSKAKKVAGSKVVKEVAKVAACTMVPGGQAVAGAIDAASAKSAGEAAQGAAAAATGSSCMPGMGGAGMANAAAEAAASSATPSGPPQGMMPYGAGGPPGYPGGQSMMAQTEASDRAMAQCLGLSVEDYQAMARPAGYEPRAPTNDEMKRAGKISKKVGAQRQAQCSQQVGMQQASSQMAAMQQMMAGAQPGQTGGMPSGPPAGRASAQRRGVELDPDPAAALAAGKTTIRNIVWMGNNTDPAHAEEFDDAMVSLAQALKSVDGKLKITVYSNERYGSKDHDAYMRGLRAEAVADALTSDGIIPTSKVVVDKKGDYGEDRVEITRGR